MKKNYFQIPNLSKILSLIAKLDSWITLYILCKDPVTNRSYKGIAHSRFWFANCLKAAIDANKSGETPGTRRDRYTFVRQVHESCLFISGSRGFVPLLPRKVSHANRTFRWQLLEYLNRTDSYKASHIYVPPSARANL